MVHNHCPYYFTAIRYQIQISYYVEYIYIVGIYIYIHDNVCGCVLSYPSSIPIIYPVLSLYNSMSMIDHDSYPDGCAVTCRCAVSPTSGVWCGLIRLLWSEAKAPHRRLNGDVDVHPWFSWYVWCICLLHITNYYVYITIYIHNGYENYQTQNQSKDIHSIALHSIALHFMIYIALH